MPLYEYECESCQHRFERIQKFSDPPVDTCPVCGGPVHKLLSSPAIQFKGSGWYITDYARKGSGDGSKSSEKKADATTADAKPAAGGGEKSASSTTGASTPGSSTKSD
jgi:putative FmdB family regulatory protein